MIIESSKNQLFKLLHSLTTSRGLKAEGLFLLSGEKLIKEFLHTSFLEIVYEVVAPNGFPLTQAETLYLAKPLFNELDVLGTHFNILVLQQPVFPLLSEQNLQNYKPTGIEIIVPLGDPSNLGALIRSCVAFSVPRIILTHEAAHPFLPKVVKASAGSVLKASLAKGPALIDFPTHCIALDQHGHNIKEFIWPKDGLLLLGEEGPGLPKKDFTHRVRIPTRGVESLNVVVAASIALSQIPVD